MQGGACGGMKGSKLATVSWVRLHCGVCEGGRANVGLTGV